MPAMKMSSTKLASMKSPSTKRYSMKQACELTGLSYETLKFYCNQGLVPNVKRDDHNHRVFTERDIAWINSLNCLRSCNMSLAEMKEYIELCLQGKASIPQRQVILAAKRKSLEADMQRLQESIDYIDWKQGFYKDVLEGRTEYHSNLLAEDE